MKARQKTSLVLLLGKKDGVDVGEDTTLGDGDSAAQSLQLFVVADGELDVSGVDSGLLVVPGGVASQLDHLGGEVLEHGGQVDWSASADSISPVAVAKHSVHSADGERQSSAGGAALFASLGLLVERFSSGHVLHFQR